MRGLLFLVAALVFAASANGATISLTDQTWTCNQPILSYGAPPLTVVLDYTEPHPGQGVRLGAGCVGPLTAER